MLTLSIALVAAIALTMGPHLWGQPADRKGSEFFETKIRPELVEHCYSCHSEVARKNRKLNADKGPYAIAVEFDKDRTVIKVTVRSRG
jgi:cbb3-type cytochrome oxidase cytochrome c subunit